MKGSRFYSILEDLLGHGIFNVDGDIWTVQRKIASHEFNTKSLRHFIANTVQSHLSTRLIPLLSTTCENDNIIDLQDIFQKFTFDNICNVAFGTDPDCLETNEIAKSSNSSFVSAVDYAVKVSSERFMSPVAVVWKIKRLFNIGNERKYKAAIGIINDYAMNIIRSKERDFDTKLAEMDQERRHDLLSRFMFSASDLGFADQDEKRKFLRDIVISFVLAGKDSTSTALTWFFWLISGHPQCERLIYNELSNVATSSPPSSPKVFNYDELKNLHYLHAAISESLRLFPPVPMNSRLTIADDHLPDGTFVAKGWFADYSAYAMGRMERVWGPDCREFKPERWLDEESHFQPSDQFKFPVFHCGPRLCLGKEMAYVQMKSVAAALLYGFKVEAVDGGGFGENLRNPPYVLSLVLKMRGGLHVRLKKRENCW